MPNEIDELTAIAFVMNDSTQCPCCRGSGLRVTIKGSKVPCECPVGEIKVKMR